MLNASMSDAIRKSSHEKKEKKSCSRSDIRYRYELPATRRYCSRHYKRRSGAVLGTDEPREEPPRRALAKPSGRDERCERCPIPLSRVTELCAVMDRIVNFDQGTAQRKDYVPLVCTLKNKRFPTVSLAQLVEHGTSNTQTRVRFSLRATSSLFQRT